MQCPSAPLAVAWFAWLDGLEEQLAGFEGPAHEMPVEQPWEVFLT